MRITTKGLDEFQRLMDQMPAAAAKASVLSVNSTIRFGYAEASRGIRSEVNLPRAYIGSPATGNRLRVTQYAKPGNPKGVIAARHRATSLARYAQSRSLVRGKGVRVAVKRGAATKLIKRAFLIRLKKGASLTQDNYNLGLALRLREGEVVKNKRSMIQYSGEDPNLYLLYAPSIDQVFRSVVGNIEPRVSSYLRREWLRQFERLNLG